MKFENKLDIFCGIVEGEGNFYRTFPIGNCRLMIANTDMEIINFCKEILDEFGIRYSSIVRPFTNSKWKTLYVIQVCQSSLYHCYQQFGNRIQCRNKEFQILVNTKDKFPEVTPNLHWCVGAFEGEGYIGIGKSIIGKELRIKYKPQVKIANTNLAFIEKVDKTLRKYDIIGCTCEEKEKEHKKLIKVLQIQNMHTIVKFLDLFKNLWVSYPRWNQGDLVSAFCKSRLSHGKRKTPYTNEEIEIYEQLRVSRVMQRKENSNKEEQ